ncbi:hypothetical protein NDU88_007634 [Pleurodeles waltl]|uniref:Reverse transcriptase zinc-binding domain-containing protein n=1 Tax=Pleurodeles waltl TaxID=8319 RepID=A0AAV7NYI6_PLEWA|nr:hypothetical protein NDU88_007634 [Pleurodeles waltl]
MHTLVINDWMGGGWTDPAYQLELQTMGYPRILDILYGSPIPRDTPDVTKVVLLGWRTAQKVTGWWGRLTQQTPLWHGKQLIHVAGLEGFQKWDTIGISTLGDIWRGTHIRSFQDLQKQYSLNKTQFHRYLQLRHALLVHLQTGDTIPEHSPMEAKALMGDLGRGGVSQIYRTLITATGGPLRELRQRWESWVGSMEEADWTEALMAPCSLTMATRFRLIQSYFLHAAYLTPAMLHKAGLRPTAECPRCRYHTADFYHMVWTCPIIMAYWEKVVQEISEVLQEEVKRSPLPLLLGVMGDTELRRADRSFLGVACLVAKRDIMADWKARVAPALAKWRRGVDWCAQREKLVYEARGCLHKHKKIWGKGEDVVGL